MNNSTTVSRRQFTALAAGLAATALPSASRAQDNRPVTLVVPFAPGGPVDTGARMLAPRLSAAIGRPVLVDNRPGGGATIAAHAVLNSPADGLTLMLQTMATVTPTFVRSIRFDVLKDFEPVSPIWKTSYFLFIGKSVPARDAKEFFALVRKAPQNFNFGYGTASSLLMAESLKQGLGGVDLVTVPYKGSAPTSLAMLSGEIQATFDLPGPYRAHVDSGTVRPLLYSGSTRSPALPEVPTAREVGMRSLDASLYGGIWAKAGAPKELLRRIHAAVQEILKSPDIQAQFVTNGWAGFPGSPEELMAATRGEVQFWKSAAEAARYEPQ